MIHSAFKKFNYDLKKLEDYIKNNFEMSQNKIEELLEKNLE